MAKLYRGDNVRLNNNATNGFLESHGLAKGQTGIIPDDMPADEFQRLINLNRTKVDFSGTVVTCSFEVLSPT